MRLDRFGVDPAEVGIALLVDLGDADLPAAQKARQPAGTGAPHRLDQHVDVRGAQGVQVDRPSQEALVARKGVEAFDPSGGLRVGERPLLDVAAAVLGNRRLENLEDLRPGRGAAGRLDLEAVVGPRVVAGRDDDAGCRSPLDHLVRRHLRRHRVDGVGDRDVACQQDFGRSDGEVFRGEPAVVGDDHAFRLLALLFDVAGNTVGAPTDVLESELVRDPSPPAVRPEDDPGGSRRRRDLGHVPLSCAMTRSRSASSARSSARAPASSAMGDSDRMLSCGPAVIIRWPLVEWTSTIASPGGTTRP